MLLKERCILAEMLLNYSMEGDSLELTHQDAFLCFALLCSLDYFGSTFLFANHLHVRTLACMYNFVYLT